MITLKKHLIALEVERGKFETERDRRYAEVNTEKEKALKIKETADLTALQLAREIQTYKDEKANELRSQIESERGTYVSKDELNAAVAKLEARIAAGAANAWTRTIAVAAVIATVVVGLLVGLH